MLIPIFRLAQLQLFSIPSYLEEVKRLQGGSRQQTQTIRGRILDRNERVLASEEPLFKLYVTYDKITRYADERVQRAMRLSAQSNKADPGKALAKVNEDIEKGLERIAYLLILCEEFGFSSTETERTIASENNKIWNLRVFQAWRNNCRTSPLYLQYQGREGRTPGKLARADFERVFPSGNERILIVSDSKYDILDMYSFFPLVELRDYEDLFRAQTELLDVSGVEITAQASRNYPFKTAASQLIGWVGPATQTADLETFKHDRLAKYQDGELCGRLDGVEYVCEPILRGRRGELTYDLDRNLVDSDSTDADFGEDVYLTIDIELQQEIETFLLNYDHRPCCKPGKAAVVLDVKSGEILALVSVPVYDLNSARYQYGKGLLDPDDPNTALINRALYKHYPPGSVAKPLVAIAGLESGTITPQATRGCPSTRPPAGWPRCWYQKQYHAGHDDLWPGQNNARNAIKGSCNIYFSRLAEDIELRTLQTWFSKFGYGRVAPLTKPLEYTLDEGFDLRTLRQGPGNIITRPGDRRLAGIGQSNMRVTPLQVANSMAALARNGQFLNPSLFQMHTSHKATTPEDLGISRSVLKVVLDGMDAVVNESGGSAAEAFAGTDFSSYGVHVYGKTGSTEAPESALFAGFAKHTSGKALAIAIVVEGGQSGSKDAAPLARDILQLCILRGYLGQL